MQQPMHRRAAIINGLAEMLINNLHDPDSPQFSDKDRFPNLCDLPTRVRCVQKRYVHWTTLDAQNALPAILLTYGDNGSAQESEVIGFIDETFPIAVIAVLKEGNESFVVDLDANDEPVNPRLAERDLIDLASDMHYSLASLINNNPTFGVDGVLPDKTRIAHWGGSEGAISQFEIIKFRVVVVHRYHASECV